ncbi:hypothetical protein ACQKMZ_28590 [Bacillus paramycoides]|uniref:hypothetical protein n=1 Tax=Bacillus paramycoides TaxID=2026194 RepID=UPI003D007595
MDFVCNNQSAQQACCKSQPQQCNQPSIECLKVLSVVCTKSVQKVAEVAVSTVALGIPAGTNLALVSFSNVVANPNGIVMRGTLIEGKVINSGFVPITANINIVGVATPIAVSLNLPFQAETECPGACPGDDLQETAPTIEAVLEPVLTPVINAVGAVAALATITFKVIIRTQITVSREKLVQAGVTVLGDINPDRCTTLQPTSPIARTTTFFNGS